MRKREKAMGIKPDPVVDAFLKATALEGEAHSVATDLLLRVLGLEVCSETQIGNEMIRGVSGGQKKRVTTGEARGDHLPACSSRAGNILPPVHAVLQSCLQALDVHLQAPMCSSCYA